PFTDYRLQVSFTGPGGQTYDVPGYYAADGDAANTGATSGTTWLVHIVPDQAGTWSWTASFRTGSWVAISLDEGAGSAAAQIDGESDSFTVGPTDKTGVDFRGKGMLRYVNKHHYRFAETDEYYIKTGTDGPENFFGYVDFDNTPSSNSYPGHSGDWQDGDPVWQGSKGKNIIGALNYLSTVGVNSIYTMMFNNTWGDSKQVFPWLEPVALGASIDRFDCSKLDQWGIVLDHAVTRGIHWVCVFSETENESAFEYLDDQGHTSDDVAFADTRKLYYRELIARFGHHLAVLWNLGEEINWDSPNEAEALHVDEMKQYAAYITEVDPYDHGVTVHHTSGTATNFYRDFYGDPSFTATSIQGDPNWYSYTVELREQSALAGRPLAIYWDETSPGVLSTDGIRKNLFWPHLMAGGAGAEWYLGGHDGRVDDYRDWQEWWLVSWYARQFYENYLPFADMMPRNDLISTGYCSALEGEAYGIYLPDGGSATLDLSGVSGDFTVEWFDCENGGSLQDGSVAQISGGGTVSIGTPPAGGDDWAAVVKNTDYVRIGAKNSGIEKSEKPQIRLNGSRLIIESKTAASMRAELLSLSGRKIKTLYNGDVKGSECSVSLDELNLSRGVYLLKIKAGRSIRFERIVFSGK
ncbi:MAG: DUF5060 domain-containing protein, partial [Actinobacteria bacterium]|nr:DUF5060 domain-containing protein [Actinomycetota bacterium]